MRTKVNKKKIETPKEVISLFQKLDIIYDLFEKYDIQYDSNNYEYKVIDPIIYKQNEAEIIEYKNNVVSLLELMVTDNYELHDYYEVSEYSLKDIVCDFSKNIYGRCEEIENLVLKSTVLSGQYIDSVIEGRWDKFEQNISSFPDTEQFARILMNYSKQYKYSSKEIEDKIKKYPEIAYYYAIGVKKERWTDGEASILKDIEKATEYVFELGFRWPEYENKIRNKPKRIFEYAKQVIKGKLPEELHNRMMMKTLNDQDRGSYEANEYFNWLKDREEEVVLYMKSISEEDRKSLLAKI